MRFNNMVVGLAVPCVLAACGGEPTEVSQSPAFDLTVPLSMPADNIGYDYSSHHVDEVVADVDGNLIIAGAMRFISNTSGQDTLIAKPYLLKVDVDGNTIWHQYYSDLGNWDTAFRDIELDSAGNIYLQDSDFVAKFDASGEFVWQQIYLVEGAYELTLDGDRVISSGLDSHIIDVASGDILNTLVGLGDFAYEVKVANNGDLVRATPDGVSRFDTNGNLLWTFNAPAHAGSNAGIDFVIDENDSVFVGYAYHTSSSSSVLGEVPVEMQAIDQDGNQVWRKTVNDKRTTEQGKVSRVQMFIDGSELSLVASDAQDRQLSLIDKASGNVTEELVASGAGFAQDGVLAESGELYITGWGQAQKFTRDTNTYTTFVGASDGFGALVGNEYIVVKNSEADGQPVVKMLVFAK